MVCERIIISITANAMFIAIANKNAATIAVINSAINPCNPRHIIPDCQEHLALIVFGV